MINTKMSVVARFVHFKNIGIVFQDTKSLPEKEAKVLYEALNKHDKPTFTAVRNYVHRYDGDIIAENVGDDLYALYSKHVNIKPAYKSIW